MEVQFKQLNSNHIDAIVDIMLRFSDTIVSKEILLSRFKDMFTENYECFGVFNAEELIGVCGVWYMTRHYSGKSAELDHVYLNEDYRSQGLGKKFMNWLYNYLKNNGKETVELNTYVTNHPSHKFYYNEDFKILGYHFLKKL